jgi:hypothetical protein
MAKENQITICSLQDILFPVELNDNPRMTNSEYSQVVTGIIDGEEMDLNYCSPRYELVPNAEIFPEIEEILNSVGVTYHTEYSHIANVRFYADYEITDSRFAHTIKGTTDTIHPMIRVRHSYNGMTKYAITFGYFRLVCENGLVIPVEEMSDFNLHISGKHTKVILNSVQELKSKLLRFVEDDGNQRTRILMKYDILANSKVDDVEKRIEEILKANGITAIDNSKLNTVDKIIQYTNRDQSKLTVNFSEMNDWLLYNGINAYLNDNELNISAPEKRAEKDSKVFEYMLQTIS